MLTCNFIIIKSSYVQIRLIQRKNSIEDKMDKNIHVVLDAIC